ncbi:MAG: hypothetical protein ACO3C1_08185 [Ilumatobacteraceae bacterium]
MPTASTPLPHHLAPRGRAARRRTTPLAVGAAALVCLSLVACGGADTVEPTGSTTPGVGGLPASGDATLPGPIGTESPGTTTPAATGSGEVQEGPVQIDVVVGLDSGPQRIETVAVGADITLNITNPDAADEFHIHGIDLERSVDAGMMATFNFTVTEPGTYEVESHLTETVLVVIEVV